MALSNAAICQRCRVGNEGKRDLLIESEGWQEATPICRPRPPVDHAHLQAGLMVPVFQCWENGIILCRELADQYESYYDYRNLSKMRVRGIWPWFWLWFWS